MRYRSHDEDSARWLGFRFRPGDIVISTRRRTGTTWMQMICALLIFQTADLPAPLWHLSPWLDHLVVPPEVVHARLAEQTHRRFIKTHTPLDGLPLHPEVTYIVVARHPLDSFVSLYHQVGNPAEPVHDALLRWIEGGPASPFPESLPLVLWHLSDAWHRRQAPNVLLIRYDDLCTGLESQMRAIALRLQIPVPEPAWPTLTRAATFKNMRTTADRLVPPPAPHPAIAPHHPATTPPGGNPPNEYPPNEYPPSENPAGRGTVRAAADFFRRGTPGAAREVLTADEIAGYESRAAHLAPPDLLKWLAGT